MSPNPAFCVRLSVIHRLLYRRTIFDSAQEQPKGVGLPSVLNIFRADGHTPEGEPLVYLRLLFKQARKVKDGYFGGSNSCLIW